MTDTITIETYAAGADTPVLISTETVEVPLTEHDIERRAIVAAWSQRRGELIAAVADLSAAAPGIIAANQAVQAATTTNAVVAAIKQYANANLVALGAVKEAQEGTVGMMALMERAIIWMDATMADMAEEEAPQRKGR